MVASMVSRPGGPDGGTVDAFLSRACVPQALDGPLLAMAAATGHTVNVTSITRRRAELAGRLGDLAKMALSAMLRSAACECGDAAATAECCW
jgi:hypothetical protein